MTYVDETDLLDAFKPLEEKRDREFAEALAFDRQRDDRIRLEKKFWNEKAMEMGAANNGGLVLGPKATNPFTPSVHRVRSIFDR